MKKIIALTLFLICFYQHPVLAETQKTFKEENVTILDFATYDYQNRTKNTFIPGDSIRYKIIYSFEGDEDKEYLVIARIKLGKDDQNWQTVFDGRLSPGEHSIEFDSVIPKDLYKGNLKVFARVKAKVPVRTFYHQAGAKIAKKQLEWDIASVVTTTLEIVYY